MIVKTSGFLAVWLALLIGCRRQSGAGNSEEAPSTAFERPASIERRPMRLAEEIYCLGDLAPSAVYIIDTRDGLVFVDSGLEDAYGKLRQGLSELGLDVRRLTAILLTHAHGDHTMGAQRLRHETGAKVYAGKGDVAVLRAGGPRESVFSMFEMPGVTAHPTTIDVELSGGETLRFGNLTIDVVATPGHTPGSTCYLMHGSVRALFTGDTVMTLHDVGGTYAARLSPRYGGDATAYLESLHALLAMPAPELLLPGHPQPDSAGKDPYFTPARWQALLLRGADELEELLTHFQTDGADFLDGEPRELVHGLYYLGDYGSDGDPASAGWACYALATDGELLLINAPGDATSPEQMRAALRRLGCDRWPPTAVLLTCEAPGASSGLQALVQQTECRIMRPTAAFEPQGRDKEERDETSEVAKLIKRLPLPSAVGADLFHIEWQGATIVFSGEYPIQGASQEAEQLGGLLSSAAGGAEAYVTAMRRLLDLHPDLWLPAHPRNGRNANLYGSEWAEAILLNRRLAEQARPARSPNAVD